MSLLPFSAVVGQHDAKRALLRGEKGSANTTLAREFAALLDPTHLRANRGEG